MPAPVALSRLNFFGQIAWPSMRQARPYAYVIASAVLSALTLWIALAQGVVDLDGKRPRFDVARIWPGTVTGIGGPAAAEASAVRLAIEGRLYPQAVGGYTAVFRPLDFLLVGLPLALLCGAAALVLRLTCVGRSLRDAAAAPITPASSPLSSCPATVQP